MRNTKPINFICPYSNCKKEFGKPLVLTNSSMTPSETYYACPHCLTRVELVIEDPELNLVSVETSMNPVEKTPTECPYHCGYLKDFSKEAIIPDGCLTCLKLLQCYSSKENTLMEVGVGT